MLIGFTLIAKVNLKRRTWSFHCDLFKQGKFNWNYHIAHILLFDLKKCSSSSPPSYADQINGLATTKLCPVLNK